MSDKSSVPNQSTDEEVDDTLIVPPPNLMERVQAAQRARKTSELRQSVEIPNPLAKNADDAESASPAAIGNIEK